MSCNKHDESSMIEELELETKLIRARMERLMLENEELKKQNDLLRKIYGSSKYDND